MSFQGLKLTQCTGDHETSPQNNSTNDYKSILQVKEGKKEKLKNSGIQPPLNYVLSPC